MQRIGIEGIQNDAWFKVNYIAARHFAEHEVDLNDIDAVFNEIEVCKSCLFHQFFGNISYVFAQMIFI